MNRGIITVVGRVGNVRIFEDTDDQGIVRKTVTFGVAVDQRRRVAEGQPKPPAVWTNFRARNSLADMLAKHLVKGRLVLVVGADPILRNYERPQRVRAEINNKPVILTVPVQETATDYFPAVFQFLDAPPNGEGEAIAVTVVASSESDVASVDEAGGAAQESADAADAGDPADPASLQTDQAVF